MFFNVCSFLTQGDGAAAASASDPGSESTILWASRTNPYCASPIATFACQTSVLLKLGADFKLFIYIGSDGISPHVENNENN